MSAAPLATSVPVFPMAQPMSAAFRAGASLTPSPVMATTWPRRCQAWTMRILCSGVTGRRRRRPRSPPPRSPGEEVQPRPVDGLVPRPVDVQLLGDGHGGVLVVPGDHHRADARPGAPVHRLPDLRPGRVHHADEAHEGELGLQALRRHGLGQGGLQPLGHRQHPQGLAYQVAPHLGDPPPVPVGEGGRGPGPPAGGCTGPAPPRGPFTATRASPIGQGVAGGHPFADRVKGASPRRGHVLLQGSLLQAAWAAAWAMAVSVGSPM